MLAGKGSILGTANVPEGSKRKIDPSHPLAHINGITFCTKCGIYAVKIVRELANGCKMKVSNPTKARNLKRLLHGRLPAGMTWPSPGVATPEFLRPYIA